ncbi:hypothetical protein PAL_GLEAN10008083 [Pteropus alecto]|uniref:Uncharacterized protein n=1 Tax=Pteropus alecto TaxID=9402 RepID=L5K046_PTEAL|nr:hypothetical protein PAL_GLEAN10008083 [Pteropus alecto]
MKCNTPFVAPSSRVSNRGPKETLGPGGNLHFNCVDTAAPRADSSHPDEALSRANSRLTALSGLPCARNVGDDTHPNGVIPEGHTPLRCHASEENARAPRARCHQLLPCGQQSSSSRKAFGVT